MPQINTLETFQHFKKKGRNSSHFVWHLAELKFYQTSENWIFGYQQIGNVTLLPLEPLIPGSPSIYTLEHVIEFQKAWKEFSAFTKSKINVFISVYTPFIQLLEPLKFRSIKIGEEPWLDLKHYLPRGNAGKGVRSARNQAIRSGMEVQEWPAEDIDLNPFKRAIIQKLFDQWRKARFLQLPGFMNSTDPFAFSEIRRYFVALTSKKEVCGYLIATPIPAHSGYFLEDLILSPDAPRGVGELLTLESLYVLERDEVPTVSLGVITATSLEVNSVSGPPHCIQLLILKLPKLVSLFYNFNGMEIFRKRFKPQKWEGIHLAVLNENTSGASDSIAWLRVLFAILWAFKPKLNFSFSYFYSYFKRTFNRTPITWTVVLSSFVLFIMINHTGKLPNWALTQFGFTGSAPLYQWAYRSIISDLLYFDPIHFWLWGGVYFALLYWSEKTHKKKFFIPYFIILTVFDDILNYALLIKPFDYFQPLIFKHLIAFKDVGGSLCMTDLLGLQLCQFRKGREFFFVGIAISIVFGCAFASGQMPTFVLNLNHFLFFCIGFISGKIKFEIQRFQNQSASKGKTPLQTHPQKI